MNFPVASRPAMLTALFCAFAPLGSAQSFYVVRKSQHFYQTNGSVVGSGFSATIAAPPSGNYLFSAKSVTPATLTLPSGGTQSLPPWSADNFELVQSFTSQATLDAAFPGGTYRMTGASIPSLSFNLTVDSYPTASQAVLATNWNGGVLVVNPAQGGTLTFGGNSSYATAGIGGRMSIKIVGLTDSVNLKNEIWNRPVYGFAATAAPFTSFAIPPGALARGGIYHAQLEWDTATTLDTTTIPNGGAIAFYGKVLRFFIAAQSSGDPVPPAPVISAQPANQTAGLGGSAVFNLGLTVGGSTPAADNSPIVLWFFNGQQITVDGTKYSSANGANLTINNLSAADAGRYFAQAVNLGGLATTSAATLTVSTTVAPSISRQPVSLTVASGSTAVFSVAATGVPNPTYQWRQNGLNVPSDLVGATGPTLVVQNAGAAAAGTYSVVITNGAGAVTSTGALLNVSQAVAEPGRLANLSILTPLAVGESMTMGTVLGGAGTGGSKPLLARAAGPALAQLGVSNFLPDPTMTLNFTTPSPALVVASNNDWGGVPALVSAFASVGAFPYTSASSKDAAIFQPNLAQGNYTLEVRDSGNGAGAVIAEIYDATTAGAFTSATPRLINVSVLKSIAAGTSLTAGFVIGGSTAKTVLIRAVGPGLTPLGVGGAMPDPQFTLTFTTPNPAVVVASNNDWAGDPALSQTASRVGAFAVNNPTSRDAMLLMTLAPGNYTAQVSPASGTAGGTAIIEIYEVP